MEMELDYVHIAEDDSGRKNVARDKIFANFFLEHFTQFAVTRKNSSYSS